MQNINQGRSIVLAPLPAGYWPRWNSLEVLPYDMPAAAHYGNIRAVLEQQGTPIGVNDLHIAGQARSWGLVLVTNNLREFQRVPGLLLEN